MSTDILSMILSKNCYCYFKYTMFTKLNVQVLKHVSAYTELTNGHICVNSSSIKNRNYSSKSRQTSSVMDGKREKQLYYIFSSQKTVTIKLHLS